MLNSNFTMKKVKNFSTSYGDDVAVRRSTLHRLIKISPYTTISDKLLTNFAVTCQNNHTNIESNSKMIC